MKEINSLKFAIILLLWCAMFNYPEAQVSQIVYSTIGTHTFTVASGVKKAAAL